MPLSKSLGYVLVLSDNAVAVDRYGSVLLFTTEARAIEAAKKAKIVSRPVPTVRGVP